MIKTMNQTMNFENAQLGVEVQVVVGADGEPMFVASGLAKGLGYRDAAAMTRLLDADERGTQIVSTPGGCQKKTVISESGLYHAVMNSRLPQARLFRRWVTQEVLPQIRQTGGYIPTRDADGRKLSDEEVMTLSNRIMQRTISKKNLPADDCVTATELAAALGLEGKAKLLNSMLVDRGIIHWAGGRYRLTAKYEDCEGLDSVRFFDYYTRKGEHRERPYQVWTSAGVEFVKKMLAR
ncbi:MAG: phage antirepressor KilAC domain-containing protein [Prevotella sp.]|nr:phage antirepressor KilAC domain-containing protein [Prevotella sp.]